MKIYIHVGYPKNASTTLQMDVFPRIKNTLYLGRRYDQENTFLTQELSKAFYDITMLDSVDCDLKKVKKIIYGYIESECNQYDNIVISSEAFANNMSDRGVMASRLKSIFPDAKIIIVIRNQMDALRSMYSFIVKQRGLNINVSYGRPAISSFEKWILDQEKFIGRSFINTLKYFDFISLYNKLFDKENVNILLFEDLVRNPDFFYTQLAGIFNDDEIKNIHEMVSVRNKGLTKRATSYYRIRSLFPNVALSSYFPKCITKYWRGYIGGGEKQKEDLSAEIEERLLNIYRPGNKLLEESLKCNLSDKGYQV